MKRRTFLKQTTFTSAALMTSSIIIPKQKKNLGVALVGLGYYSTDLLAPALQRTSHCHLAGIVTGNEEKSRKWQKKHGLKEKNIYSYDNMDGIANNPDIDVIYIVLPTGLHSQYAIKAANTGKHVWCEKPMARTQEECQEIINACIKNKVKLSIGYRMQHEPNTRKIMEWAHTRPYGKINKVHAEAGYYDGRTDHWKLKKEMGGGAIYDMGVYTINGIRYASGEEPISVTASQSTERPKLFHEVDETTSYQLNYKSGLVATGETSFGKNMNRIDITCINGSYYLDPFQSYSGVKGKTIDGILLKADPRNQQARQMDDDALSIINDTDVLVPGEEGMKDIIIVEAINKAASTGKTVNL